MNLTTSRGEPLLGLWFGHFYCPAFDDPDFVDFSAEKIRALGFNAVELDMKDWEDLRNRAEGKAAEPYVAMAEHLISSLHAAGLPHMFLAIYLNGDNLYPAIRFSPPIYGESVTAPDGKDGRWYRYWSEHAQARQAAHVSELFSLYREGHLTLFTDGEERLPLCSMWDPIVAPSFDEDGNRVYRDFLRSRYGDISALNQAYGTDYMDFEAIDLRDVWYRARENTPVTRTDFDTHSVRFHMWVDNALWRSQALTDYFAAMASRLHELDPSLYLMPNLSQWGHLLNIDTSLKSDIGMCELWDTAVRGIDMRRIAPHVDMCHFYALPVTMQGDPDAYVVACQHAHMRSMNPFRPFLGGIFYGRFLYNDIYRLITPEEVVGSIVASGAAGIMAYGYGGMDDGGMLHRMDEGFTESLQRANLWAKTIIPKTGTRKQSRVAILFPPAMALLEPLSVEGNERMRYDLLGYYHALCDWGFAPDIVEEADVIAGLSGYDVLILPADDCYPLMRSEAMEKAIRNFVRVGHTVIHGQAAHAALLAFDLQAVPTESTCYTYEGEGGLLLGGPHVSFPGEVLARWREDGTCCISRHAFGQGNVYSFGFMPGYQYTAKPAPHVPLSQGNKALYPFVFMAHQPLRDILLKHTVPDTPLAMKDVECAVFDNGYIAVNHRSTPVLLPASSAFLGQQPIGEQILPAHSAVWIES